MIGPCHRPLVAATAVLFLVDCGTSRQPVPNGAMATAAQADAAPAAQARPDRGAPRRARPGDEPPAAARPQPPPAAAGAGSFVPSPRWPQLPALVFEPPTRGYGDEVVAYGRSIGAYPWPTIRNYMVRGGETHEYTLDGRDRERLARYIDRLVPHDAVACFLDLEDHVKLYNRPDTDEATQAGLRAYNEAIVDFVKSRRPNTRFAVWNHPNREQVLSQQTQEWRRRQLAWQPLIRKAGICSANGFIWWNDVEKDLAWMEPYLRLCLEIAGDQVPVYVTVAAGQQGEMNPVSRQTLEAIWRRLAEVEVDGRRIAGFDLYMPYKAKNPQWERRGDPVPKKEKMTPEEARANDDLLKWSMDTLLEIIRGPEE